MACVLVIDDQAVNRELVVTLLEHRGHRAIEASDGAEALALVRSERPDLVISDILMPTMDGFEFVRQMRADPVIASTEVIFYTAHYHEREARNLARACGVTRVLIKPSEPEQMLRTIDEALANLPQPVSALVEPEFDREHLRLMTDKLSEKVTELRSANFRLAALNDVNLKLASERDPRALLKAVCRDGRELVGARYAVLCVRDKTNGSAVFCTTSGIGSELSAQLPVPGLDAGVLGKVVAKSGPFRGVNPDGDPQSIGLPAGYPTATAWLAAPVTSLNATYGWICLANKLGDDQFDDEDERILSTLASQVGRIYENGSLYAELRRHTAQLEAEAEKRAALAAALREREGALGRAQLLAKLAHIISRPDGSFESWSDSLPRLIGFDAPEVPDTRAWLGLLHPDDRERFRSASLEGARTGTHFEIEYRLRRRDGEMIHVRQVIEPLPGESDARGRARWFSTLQDISEQKRAEEEVRRLNADLEQRVVERTAELEAANKELEAFDYSVSHDLRAPLRHIQGFGGMLLSQHSERLDESGQDCVKRVLAASKRMDQLVTDLLHLSTATRGELNRADIDVSGIAEAVLANLKKAQGARQVTCVVEPGLKARADPGLVLAVLDNLLGNAWKFTRKRDDARIEFGAARTAGQNAFFVRDNGAGFDMAYADKLFAPLQRLHSQQEFEGTGIGLATVQRIIRRHGGKVWAESSPGEGATFYFTL